MMYKGGREIVVFDIGKTNLKIHLLSDDGTLQLVKAVVPLDGMNVRFVRLKTTRP